MEPADGWVMAGKCCVQYKTRPQTVLHSALSHAYSPDGFLMVPDGFLMVPDGFLMVPDGFLMVSVGSLPQNSVIQFFSPPSLDRT